MPLSLLPVLTLAEDFADVAFVEVLAAVALDWSLGSIRYLRCWSSSSINWVYCSWSARQRNGSSGVTHS